MSHIKPSDVHPKKAKESLEFEAQTARNVLPSGVSRAGAKLYGFREEHQMDKPTGKRDWRTIEDPLRNEPLTASRKESY